jgi:hypothetical protein
MFKRGITIFSLGMALAMPWQHAQAATGNTTISIDFPDIIILNYIDDVNLTFNAGSIATDTANTEGTASGTANIDGTPATFDLAVDGTTGTNPWPASVNVVLENAWAVRGITTTGQIDVSITIVNADATNGGSTATMNSQTVTSGGSTGSTIQVTSPGFVTPAKGDVNFALDLSGVSTAQNHAGMEYQIQAVATP